MATSQLYCGFSKSRVVVRVRRYIDAGSFKFEFSTSCYMQTMKSIQRGGRKIICITGILIMTTKHTFPQERQLQVSKRGNQWRKTSDAPPCIISDMNGYPEQSWYNIAYNTFSLYVIIHIKTAMNSYTRSEFNYVIRI